MPTLVAVFFSVACLVTVFVFLPQSIVSFIRVWILACFSLNVFYRVVCSEAEQRYPSLPLVGARTPLNLRALSAANLPSPLILLLS